MQRELDLHRASVLCNRCPHKHSKDQKKRTKESQKRRTSGRFAIDEEYPPRLDATGAPLDAALLDFRHGRILL
jgi:hypothetical protein